jgi:hypothetical protein
LVVVVVVHLTAPLMVEVVALAVVVVTLPPALAAHQLRELLVVERIMEMQAVLALLEIMVLAAAAVLVRWVGMQVEILRVMVVTVRHFQS